MRGPARRAVRGHPAWYRLALPALLLVLGLSSARPLLALTSWMLRDRFLWQAEHIGLLGLGIFATGFLLAALARALGPRGLTVAGTVSLGAFYLAMHAWAGDPLVELVLAAGAVVSFVLSLGSYLLFARQEGLIASRRLGLGLLLGLALDSAVRGSFGTLDTAWLGDPAARGMGAGLAVALWGVLWALLRTAPGREEGGGSESRGASGRPAEATWRGSLSWLAVGPFLFLELQVFGNMARLATLTGWEFPLAFAWLLFGHAAGIGAALWAVQAPGGRARGAAFVAGVVLVGVLASPAGSGAPAALLVLAGQVAGAVLLVRVAESATRAGAAPGAVRTALAHGLGMVLLLALLFAYYAAYDMSLPFSSSLVPPVAGLLVWAGAMASRSAAPEIARRGADWLPVRAALALVVVPLAWAVTWHPPVAGGGEGFPLRVMTYNLHTGFDPVGALDLEAQARTIESQNPDVVALQEVSRGWVIGGSVDMMSWLSRRLELPYMYGPTAGPMWGNALLSRYPVERWGTVALPPDDLPIRRGFIWARLDLGADGKLLVMNTHLHHVEEETAVRVRQTEVLREFLKGERRAVLMGDLNTRPGEQPVGMLRDAGLGDALELAGVAPGFTTPPGDPRQRVDYVWVSPDLAVQAAGVPRSLASDHLPVVATLGSGP